MITGVVFVYAVVMPLCVGFFLDFSDEMPLPPWTVPHTIAATPGAELIIPLWTGDPVSPKKGQIWFNAPESRIKLFNGKETLTIQFGPSNLLSPMLTISDYIDLTIARSCSRLRDSVSVAAGGAGAAGAAWGSWISAFLRKQRRTVYFVDGGARQAFYRPWGYRAVDAVAADPADPGAVRSWGCGWRGEA